MSENSKPTQNQRILDYIRDFGSITQLDALQDLGVMRLASRISDLRKQGVFNSQRDRACHQQIR